MNAVEVSGESVCGRSRGVGTAAVCVRMLRMWLRMMMKEHSEYPTHTCSLSVFSAAETLTGFCASENEDAEWC